MVNNLGCSHVVDDPQLAAAAAHVWRRRAGRLAPNRLRQQSWAIGGMPSRLSIKRG